MATKDPIAALRDVVAAALLTLGVTALCYSLYFRLAPMIWRQNQAFAPGEIVPWVVPFTAERDGVEVYALYVLAFIAISGSVIACAWLLGGCWRPWPNDSARRAPVWRLLLGLGVAVLAALWLVRSVGFVPPENPLQAMGWTWQSVLTAGAVLAAVGLITALALQAQASMPRLVPWLAAIALIPACFIAIKTDTALSLDFNYTLSPALRLLHGAPPREVYFQYDLLPSLLAAGWMALGLELNAIRLLGQAAYFAAILAVFLLARRLFIDRNLAVLLLVALVVGRLYTSSRDVLCCFQVTPLRLELWLPLLLAVWLRGTWHWLAGLTCGLLLVFANKFGIIYTLAYLQTLAVMFGLELADRPAGVSPRRLLLRAVRRAAPPLTLILAFVWLSGALLDNETFGNYAIYYQKIGIGFLPITPVSFYWYVLPTISLTLTLLIRLRGALDRRYLETGVLLVLCAVGSLIYFFGRSHEQALLNLAIILLFVTFLLLDLIARMLHGETERMAHVTWGVRYGPVLLASILVVGMVAWYGENIAAKFTRQVTAVVRGEATYPLAVERADLQRELAAIRTATGGSDKVYFMSRWDFQYYYYGGYRPIGYVNPFWAWIFAEPLRVQLNALLDDGWFLVLSDEMRYLLDAFAIEHDITHDAAGLLIVARSAPPLPAP